MLSEEADPESSSTGDGWIPMSMEVIMSMFSLPQKTTANEVATAPRLNLLDQALSSPSKTTSTSSSTFGPGAFARDQDHDGNVAYSVSSTTAQIPSGTTSKPSRQPKRETTVPSEFNLETTVPSTIPPAPTVPVGKGLSKVTLVELMKAMGLMGLSLDGDGLPDYTGPGEQSSDEDSGDKDGSGSGDDDGEEGSVAHQSDHDHNDKDDVAYSVSKTTAQVPLTITGTTSILTTKSPSKNATESILANLVEAVPAASGETAVPDSFRRGPPSPAPRALVAGNRSDLKTTKSATTNATSSTKATTTSTGTTPLVPITTGTPSTSSTLATTSRPKMTLTTGSKPTTAAVSAKVVNTVLDEVEIDEVATATTPMTPTPQDGEDRDSKFRHFDVAAFVVLH